MTVFFAISFYVWMRWGRVGYKGQTSLTPCGPDAEKAKNVFSKKFSDKTRNEWEERGSGKNLIFVSKFAF